MKQNKPKAKKRPGRISSCSEAPISQRALVSSSKSEFYPPPHQPTSILHLIPSSISLTPANDPHTPAGPKILEALPEVIVLLVLAVLAESGNLHTLANLARTCKLLHNLTLSFIYRDIHLSSVESYEALLRALGTPTSKASLVDVVGREYNWRRKRNELGVTTKGSRLVAYFRMTKSITLGAFPSEAYDWRLTHALTTCHVLPVETLFPHAKFLRIAILPNQSRDSLAPAAYPSGPTQRTKSQDALPFLARFCRPDHICLVKHWHDTGETQYQEQITRHLSAGTWDTSIPTLSLHGQLFPYTSLQLYLLAYEPSARRELQSFRQVRLHLSSEFGPQYRRADIATFEDRQQWALSAFLALTQFPVRATGVASLPRYVFNIQPVERDHYIIPLCYGSREEQPMVNEDDILSLLLEEEQGSARSLGRSLGPTGRDASGVVRLKGVSVRMGLEQVECPCDKTSLSEYASDDILEQKTHCWL